MERNAPTSIAPGLIVARIGYEEYYRLRKLSGPEIAAELDRRKVDVLELDDDPTFRLVR
jgi:hypothetical protein